MALVAETELYAQAPRLLNLDIGGGHLGFEVEYDNQELESTGQDIQEREVRFLEELGLQVSGSLYHPRLFLFDLSGALGFEQSRVESSGSTPSNDHDGLRTQYDFLGTFLSEHPVSMDLFANRAEIRTTQRFFPTTESVHRQEGADLRWGVDDLPGHLRYEHSVEDGSGLDTTDEERHRILFETSRLDEGDELRARYEWNNVQLDDANTDFTVSDASLHALFRLGDRDQNRWFSNLRFRDQSGTSDVSNLSANTSLNYEHLSNLRSDYIVDWNRSSSDDFDQDALSATTGLTHTLYRNLTSNVRANAGVLNSDSLDQVEIGVGASLNYRRSLPFGSLNLSFLHEERREDEESSGGVVQVLDEPQVFQAGVPLLLDSTAIDLQTIVVTDATGLILFLEGMDYLVDSLGAFTRLTLPIGSMIAPGQQVLVDYEFDSQPDRKFRTQITSAQGSVEVDDWASIGGGWDSQRQALIDGVDNGTLDDSRRRSAHVRVFHWGWRAGVRWDDTDSDQFAFTRVLYSTGYERRLGDRTRVDLSAELYRIQFDDRTPDESGISALLRLEQRLATQASLELLGEGRKVDLRTDEGSGFFIESRLLWTFRQFSMDLNYRFFKERFDVAKDQEGHRVALRLTRRF